MGTATLPASNKSWVDKLPIISHLKMSSGLQRGMLISGLVLTGLFLIAAIFAPLIAPFGFAQSGNANGDFPRRPPRAGNSSGAPPPAATTCSPAPSSARRPRSS